MALLTSKLKLKRGTNTINRDKAAFQAWMDGKISIYECINEFRFNNRIKKDVVIDPIDFELWLNSLGYWRSMT